MSSSLSSKDLFKFMNQITSAYISNHKTDLETLPDVINLVFYGLNHANKKYFLSKPSTPPIPLSETVTDDCIICLEDGKKFKMLKKHLHNIHEMTPEDYKEKWGLPTNYPIVAPNYAKKRSQIAKETEFGLTHKKTSSSQKRTV